MTRTAAPALRLWLLCGTSALAVAAGLTVAAPARAQSVAGLRAAAGLSMSASATVAPMASAPSLIQQNQYRSASSQALRSQARAASAVDMATQAQVAARAAAAALASTVPDGLGPGGLQPVANPVTAVNDVARAGYIGGLKTWQGAAAPVQASTATGVQVTVQQTAPTALLSWESFNVGRDTSLVFDQSQGGAKQPSWVVLNRVVGQLNPATGLRDPRRGASPSQILGSIKADGTVLVLNQNGVLFGGHSQVDTHSIAATSLEIGRANASGAALAIPARNQAFLNFGLLGFADQASGPDQSTAYTFSAQTTGSGVANAVDPAVEGAVTVQGGAQLTAHDGGYVLLTGPQVSNAGLLTAADGQVSLQSGRQIFLNRSQGAADSLNPNVRGLVASSQDTPEAVGNAVSNTGLIQAPRGYVSLGATNRGGVIQGGVLTATTSVSRNGFIQLSGGDIQLSPSSVLAITPDIDAATIPQDPVSLQAYKTSRVQIGSSHSRIDLGANSLIYAPSADVAIGEDSGEATEVAGAGEQVSRVFVDTGATIDVSGLENVLIPASRNQITIKPVKKNELQDTPTYKNSFLNGATVTVDPRISGVRADGVAYVGSPLIAAGSYAQQVGVGVSELMTKGGAITVGVQALTRSIPSGSPDIIVKPGAVFNIAGGSVRYEAGRVQTTRLITADGRVVDIGSADPNDTYVGIYNGYTDNHPRWGVSTSFGNPLLDGVRQEAGYSEGRDAGSMVLKSSVVAFEGQIIAAADPGPRQKLEAKAPTGTATLYGDLRPLQAAPSQLPSGGFFMVQALGALLSSSNTVTGGDDILVTRGGSGLDLSALQYGQTLQISGGGLTRAPRSGDSFLPTDLRNTILLSADGLSDAGLGQLSLRTSGKVDVASDAQLNLAPGAVVDILAGRAITIDGVITAPSGSINLQTANLQVSSPTLPTAAAAGSFDININGTLSVAGLWVNDINQSADNIQGAGHLDGGSITLAAAPRATVGAQQVVRTSGGATSTDDISGNILVNGGARLDLSGGGYVAPSGKLVLTSRGGDLTLSSEDTYFQFADDTASRNPGGLSGFRVGGILSSTFAAYLPVNPSKITAKVTLAEGTVLAHGFAGGGTFSLFTPQFGFGTDAPSAGTNLPLDFFSKAGFGAYDITSYKTDLIANNFSNGLGGYNAVLATQTLTVGDGETLSLVQSQYSPLTDAAQSAQLRALATGASLSSVLTPIVPVAAWDQKAIDLTLGGLMELHVARGGTIRGAAGTALTAPKLFNEGTIILPGGSINQVEALPTLFQQGNAVAVHSLDDLFSADSSGHWTENGPNRLGLRSGAGVLLTNAQVAAQRPVYLLGQMEQGEGVRLGADSVTDLSGVSILNPRAASRQGQQLQTGRIIAGGSIETAPDLTQTHTVFTAQPDSSTPYSEFPVVLTQRALSFGAAAGARIDVSGAADAYDQRSAADMDRIGARAYTSTPVWSDAGSLTLNGAATLGGAQIAALGGAPLARGGTLTVTDPILTQSDPVSAGVNQISAAMIESAGFDTLVAQGSLSTNGGVALSLNRGFFLTTRNYGGVIDGGLTASTARDLFVPTVSLNGNLDISAPLVVFDSAFQSLRDPATGAQANYTASFHAQEIDVSGAVRFDRSVGTLNLDSAGAVRLIGVQPWQKAFNLDPNSVSSSLAGQLTVNNNLNITAAQVYPTTGSSYLITSAGNAGAVTFAARGPTPATPYSAGGALTVQASTIVQGGVVRAPVGALTFGSNTALSVTDGGVFNFAPATRSVALLAGSVTSVSADGLSIPYGTTTDQKEYFFAPTSDAQLTRTPTALLRLDGQQINTAAGASVDLAGGGDLYAYEFVPGTGGSRDVLDRFNADDFTGDNGYQYPDKRQVYAIVPGLSADAIAAMDPIYSADYANLYNASGAGKRVYLAAAPGLAAGWYNLLPAKYALLPGGMRVVENTGAAAVAGATSVVQPDGSMVVTGRYGDGPSNTAQSDLHTFTVQSQAVIRSLSNIATTSATQTFTDKAAHDEVSRPRLPNDAARLVLDPVRSLALDATFNTAAATGGRGAQVDITGQTLSIVSDPATVTAGISLSADSLTRLNAASLLIGGTRTEMDDGTTSLQVTAHRIVVQNDAAHPLSGKETILAVDGEGALLAIRAGSVITASGVADDSRTDDIVIAGSQGANTGRGALVRVSANPERLLERQAYETAQPATLAVDAAQLSGPTVMMDSSANFALSASAVIRPGNVLDVGAASVSFADNGPDLAIGAALLPQFESAASLYVRSKQAIGWAGGRYAFHDLTLDAPGLLLASGATSVDISSGKLRLGNQGADAGACGASGAPLCATGALSFTATEIAFNKGTLHTYGFGGAVVLNAAGGIFAENQSVFDVGAADLTLNTPFVGDRAGKLTFDKRMTIPSLTLVTTGSATLANPAAAAAMPSADGVPGSSLSLQADRVSIDDVRLRATAGLLTVHSNNALAIGGSAVLEAPGYDRSFGDVADPFSVSAPAGALNLVAANGDISLGASAELSVGGDVGKAGLLSLSAPLGAVSLSGRLVGARAGEAGGSIAVDSLGAFDYSAFERSYGAAFNGDIHVHTRTGDLSLDAGLTASASSVRLTADGGRFILAGGFDTSGVNGGAVSLYGSTGVSLLASAQITARATGYAADDSRVAKGGDVTLGVGASGAIQVASGATIDVSAARPTGRLVSLMRNGQTFYSYAEPDQGGSVALRAPIIAQAGPDTVNVDFAGRITGAQSVVLEGYQRFDLAQIAADPAFSGVTIAGGTATLTVASTANNFFAADKPGSIVQFIEDFDVSGAYGRLGGLASAANFHARPGVQLDFNGNILLNSNWNLGAGVVDTAGAIAAGLMLPAPRLAGQYYIVPGDEAAVMSRFTTLTYRTGRVTPGVTGARVDGEPGVLTFRASGDLTINGSVSDGFFQFRDQTDPNYLLQAANSPGRVPLFPPYSALANLPEARGSLAGGAGDPIGSAELFPRLPVPGGGSKTMSSFSYNLLAGADDVSAADADPSRALIGGIGTVAVIGDKSYVFNGTRTAWARDLVRTGDGAIHVVAAQDIDLTNGVVTYRAVDNNRTTIPAAGGVQVGGTAIYTAGVRADTSPITVVDPATGQPLTLDLTTAIAQPDVFNRAPGFRYAYGAGSDPSTGGFGGILMANPLQAQGGGDVSLTAGRDVLGRRDLWQESRLDFYDKLTGALPWLGPTDQPWRTGTMTDAPGVGTNGAVIRVNPQLFNEGVATLGGGDIAVRAGRNVSDITLAADTSISTANIAAAPGLAATRSLVTFGGGDLTLAAGGNLLGGRLDIASGAGEADVLGAVQTAGLVRRKPVGVFDDNLTRVRVGDAALDINARQSIDLQGISALAVRAVPTNSRSTAEVYQNALGAFSPYSGVSLITNGAVLVRNTGVELLTSTSPATNGSQYAVYPGSFTGVSLTGDVTLQVDQSGATASTLPRAVILYPSPRGTLVLAAGRDISPLVLDMEDGDPGLLPGYFSTFAADSSNVLTGRGFGFPSYLPNVPDVVRGTYHNRSITHLNDPQPNRVYAGLDLDQLILSVPKQTRIGAGRDIVDMAFFGQNVAASDVTRIVAGRDITASTSLVRPSTQPASNQFGNPLPTLGGNTFVLGGPGALFIEAGRDAGPFLNSATTDGFSATDSSTYQQSTLTYGGGILTVGANFNPWLPDQGADIVAAFGVAKGMDFAALRETYLDPANNGKLGDALFVQTKDANGNRVADRSQPIYGPILVDWMKTHAAAELTAAFGTTNVTYAQAYQAFVALPQLRQETFLLGKVYFNELAQTSIPTSPSYLQYSRGYAAVNTLFPASLGYTANGSDGGANGASTLEHTGDLDLRLSTIQTERGGDIFLLGPGGRLLAGSTVRTSAQAARRGYNGGRLFDGNVRFGPLASTIQSIPTGLEGILTLRGGAIYGFTDQNLVLNQSRLFTVAGGDITLWSSNGDLNAGQGPKTSADFPPIVVRVDPNGYAVVDAVGSVSGAGIAAFQPAADVPAPDVFLIAPRGTVDAGDAGVRVAGNLFIAAQHVANADNFSVSGSTFGIPAAASVNVGVQTSGDAAGAAAQQAAAAAANPNNTNSEAVITVNVDGYAGGEAKCADPKDDKCKGQ